MLGSVQFWYKLIICLYVIPAILHSVGFAILYHFRRSYKSKIQWCYLMNLSFVETLYSMTIFSHIFLEEKKKFLFYHLSIDIGLFTWYLSIMILITVDRFLEIYLNIKYHLYCSVAKTKMALFVAFLLSSGLTCFLSLFLFTRNDTKTFLSFYNYLTVAGDGLFLAVAVVTYGFIFSKIWVHRYTHVLPSSTSSSRMLTSEETLPKKRKLQQLNCFMIPFLLVATYFVFWFVPDAIELTFAKTGAIVPSSITILFFFCYLFALVSDALIYTLLSKQTRKLLHQMVRKYGRGKTDTNANGLALTNVRNDRFKRTNSMTNSSQENDINLQ